EPKDAVDEIDLAGLGPLERGDVGLHHPPSCLSAPAALNAPGFGASFGSSFFTASRSRTQPPLEPGTAPRTITRPRATSVLSTTRFCVVTRSSPVWPAIFLPLNTLPGSWRW